MHVSDRLPDCRLYNFGHLELILAAMKAKMSGKLEIVGLVGLRRLFRRPNLLFRSYSWEAHIVNIHLKVNR